MKKRLLLTSFFALGLCAAGIVPTQSVANEKAPATTTEAEAAPPQSGATPVKQWIDAENAMIDPLNDLDRESIFIMRDKYSIIRVIDIVERDIGNAVKACGQENPQLKKRMEDRYAQWKSSVDPVIETAKNNLSREIESQTIVPVDEFKRVLKLNDAAYQFGESQTTKDVVTTREACEGLVASMDRTEDQMISLLKDTLLPESVIRKRAYQKPAAPQRKNFSETVRDQQ